MEQRTLPVQVDIHCHVLPGLDDGARDLDQALAMLRVAVQDGTSILVATPHARRCDAHAVRLTAELLREHATQQELPLELLVGMEEQLLPDLVERLQTGAALPIGDTRWVLVELPDWTQWPATLPTQLQELRAAGFRPILAHVERYIPIQREPALVLDAIQAGALLQMNADSLFGQNGYAAQQAAARLVRAGAVSILASDAHSPNWRAPRLRDAFERIAALASPETVERLRNTALAVVQDREVQPPNPDPELLATPTTFLERLRLWVGV
ncbi:MAG: tyrosine-protein phosphatase [Thermomicrobium sp.]